MHCLLAGAPPILLQACLNGSFRLVYHFECKRFGSEGKTFRFCYQ